MRLVFSVICLLIIPSIYSQKLVTGEVVNPEGEAIAFAHVIDLSTRNGVSADEGGKFSIQLGGTDHGELQVSALGFMVKRVNVPEPLTGKFRVVLTPLAQEIDEVVVTGTLYPMQMLESPVKTQVITSAFLDQIPTSSVVENLNFVNGVQEVIACGVCGTNDIHLNGMEGAYTLVLIDGMPIMSSLAAVYGLNSIPKSMVEQIEIIKGPASTQYGSEAMGGVINIVTKDPGNMPRVFISQNASTHGEFNTDVGVSGSLGKKFNYLASVNHFKNTVRLDNNHDFFTDIPLSNRLSLFTKGSYEMPSGRKLNMSLRYYEESRFGGQLNWTPDFSGSDSIYGESINTRRIEAIGSMPFGTNWTAVWSFNRHEQVSYYGDVNLNAVQYVGFMNLLRTFQKNGHQVLVGLSQKLNDYQDNSAVTHSGLSYIPGIFIQDLYNGFEGWDLLAGLRVDYHEVHGLVFSPRLNIKRNLPGDFALRLNAGTGFRVVNLFTEDHAALSGSRNIVVEEQLNPERSIHGSLNLHGILAFEKSYATLDIDAFYTGFSNMILPDYDVDPNTIVYHNLDGYGNVFGVGMDYAHFWNNGVQLALGATWMENTIVEREPDGDLTRKDQLFAPDLSVKMRLGYDPRKWGLSIDYSSLVMGPMKLPQFDPPYERNPYSPWYALHHVQVNKLFSESWKVSLAVKNLFNYTQDSPLIRPDAPFSEQFDTSYAYGPLQTRRLVLSATYSMTKAK